jgi:hypothetical protein
VILLSELLKPVMIGDFTLTELLKPVMIADFALTSSVDESMQWS